MTGLRGRRALGAAVATVAMLAAAALPLASTTAPAAATGIDPTSGLPTPVPMTVNASGDNPLAGHAWGVYAGLYEQWVAPWQSSTGSQRAALDKIAAQPKASWFGGWTPASRIGDTLAKYIAQTQNGDPSVLVQFAMFRIAPWGKGGACTSPYTRADARSYKQWIDAAAAAIGSTYSAIVVQPDSPFATQCYKSRAQERKALKLIAYASKTFSALPDASVYVEAGAADWMHDDVANALRILIPGGVKYARGFAFNGTHYDATSRNVDFGAKVAQALAARGITGKHFVINTAQNGAPFTGTEYGIPNFPDNARVCTKAQTVVPKAKKPKQECVTLGIPPTTDVANPAWGLSAAQNAEAAQYVDGYLWFGRPWLNNQNAPFVMSRAVKLAQTTPF